MNISLFEIYKIFVLIGLQLLGGGYVVLPLLQKYIVQDRKWITEEELIDYFALSQCLPGIIAGNISIFTGYKIRKTKGALIAVLGITTPSFLIILLLVNLINGIANYEIIQNMFWGIRISVIVLVILSVKEMWEKSVNSLFSYILFGLILFAILFLPVSPTILIVSSTIISYVYFSIKERKGQND